MLLAVLRVTDEPYKLDACILLWFKLKTFHHNLIKSLNMFKSNNFDLRCSTSTYKIKICNNYPILLVHQSQFAAEELIPHILVFTTSSLHSRLKANLTTFVLFEKGVSQ